MEPDKEIQLEVLKARVSRANTIHVPRRDRSRSNERGRLRDVKDKAKEPSKKLTRSRSETTRSRVRSSSNDKKVQRNLFGCTTNLSDEETETRVTSGWRRFVAPRSRSGSESDSSDFLYSKLVRF